MVEFVHDASDFVAESAAVAMMMVPLLQSFKALMVSVFVAVAWAQ